MGNFDTALICLNGHIINGAMRESPEYNKDFCRDCGAKTISKCKECNDNINGDYIDREIFYTRDKLEKAPSYCHICGKPYPWTEASIKAFKELAEIVEQLSQEEKDQLSNSIDDIIADTPRTQLAIFIIKKMAKKVSEETWGIFREIIIRIGTEAAKKQLGL